MSILDTKFDSKLTPDKISSIYEESPWHPTDEERDVRFMVLRHFTLGDVTMQKPRVEFNDLSVLGRMQYDQMSFNTYQPNNGQGWDGDVAQAWKSKAIRPIVRNKCISMAAHATARLIFPKVFASNQLSDLQEDASKVMESLMEYAAQQSNYGYYSLMRTLTALTDPASIGYTEYAEVYQNVKKEKVNGKWVYEKRLDESLSGFQNIVVPVDQLFIENFYEPDIQKQGWLLWRRVQSYSLIKQKYGDRPNFKHVKPGVQVIYNDANQSFYQVYDTNMRQWDCEEIIYWNKTLDLKVTMVNGVMISEPDAPNPRIDKKYPFDKFGAEPINNRCFYYKSLAFKMQPDANIINTLYPMFIDGTYLNMMPPMIARGVTTIGADVVIPGVVTTLDSPEANLEPLQTSNNLKAGLDALGKVEESINQTSSDPIRSGQSNQKEQTKYEISRIEQNADTILGLFIKMISDFVKSFGELRVSDILQYLTIVDVDAITDNPGLVYKTFLVNDTFGTKNQSKKIVFDANLPTEPMTHEDKLKASYDVLAEQGGEKSKQTLYKVHPELFRNLKYAVVVSPDVLNPMSEDLERAFKLEAYDRAILNPIADQEAVYKELLLGANPITRKDPDKFVAKPSTNNPMNQIQQAQKGQSPLNAVNQKSQLSQAPMPANVMG